LGRIVQVANFVLSAEAFSILNREGEIGLDLSSIREVLIFSGKGADLVTWLTAIEQLGTSLKVINSLTSVGLGLALLSPTISLIIQLRTEGRDALSGLEFYKTAGRLGMTLLTIYLFSSAMTLSALAEALLAGTDWAIS
jgi:hypothetical protein